MKTLLYLIIFLLFFPSPSLPTDLRGRVDATHSYSYRPFPAKRIQVQLIYQAPGGYRYATTTLADGMYFFRNIPPGMYTLTVHNRQFPNFQVWNVPFQDIPPILIRY